MPIETNFTSCRLLASRDGESVLIASLPDTPKTRSLLAALVMEMDDNGFWPEGCDAELRVGVDMNGDQEIETGCKTWYLDETGTTWVDTNVAAEVRGD